MGDGTKNGWEQKILWDLKLQTDKQLVANQSETVVTEDFQFAGRGVPVNWSRSGR